MNYDNAEMTDMVYIIGECDGNCLLASRMYRQRYPQRRHPHVKVFKRLKLRFEIHSTTNYQPPRKQNYRLTEEMEGEVLLSVVENPQVSQRQLSSRLEISTASINRCLKSFKYHPYHLQRVQHLREEDYPRRLHFCQWSLESINLQPDFFQHVLFTDECIFRSNNEPNRRNYHHYADANPNLTRPVDFQNRWSLNVWGGIIGPFVVGPYFFNDYLDGNAYLNFLREDLPELLEDVPLNIRQNMWLQHDGAPPHYAAAVRNFLNENFNGRWIGRGGPVAWPPKSPDITPMDFFLWGYVKNIVHSTPVTTQADMRLRIANAFQAIPQEMLINTHRSYLRRLQLCVDQNGGHFEQFM